MFTHGGQCDPDTPLCARPFRTLSLHPIVKSYAWEEPLLPPRLLVRVGPDTLRGGDLHRGDGDSAPSVAAARLQAWGVGRVSSEEAGTLSGQVKIIR